MTLTDVTAAAARLAAKAAPDAVCLAGVALVAAGLWLVHPAAALVVGGLFLAAAGVALGRRVKPPREGRG